MARLASCGAWRASRRFLLGFALLAIAAGALAWDPPRDGVQAVPALHARVTDLTGTLSASEQQTLEAKLAAWEAQTTNQLAVLVVPTTKPETIEEYALRVAEAWKLGQKGKDNGALFLIAKNDKQMRIEVGYGLEGDLTDVTSRRIIGDTVAPLFSKGQFAAGINAGVDRIIGVVSGTEPPPRAEAPRRAPKGGGIDFGTIALIMLVAIPAIGSVLRSLLGKVGGGLVGAGLTGGVVWLLAGSLIFAGIAGFIAFVLISLTAFGGRGGPGMWFPGGGGGFGGGGFGGGGGGFSGGGGGFGGGGASGGW
jgi:uncharacterized protein